METLTIVRVKHLSFGNNMRRRIGSPKRIDQLPITLTDAKGDEVCYIEVPMDQFPAEE